MLGKECPFDRGDSEAEFLLQNLHLTIAIEAYASQGCIMFAAAFLCQSQYQVWWNVVKAEPSTAKSGRGAEAADPAKRLRNQFNFSERGAQTTYFQPQERETSTDAPETAEASGTCSRWEIYDAYVADQKLQRQQVREIQEGPAY